ncbi:SDR family oxidoreductase [Chloroflexota bacterium]
MDRITMGYDLQLYYRCAKTPASVYGNTDHHLDKVAAALEYARMGIRINAVCPDATHTPMFDQAVKGDVKTRASMVKSLSPLGRIAEPEEVAAAVLWLCSEAASFVTGHCLAVDDGFTSR